MDASEEELYDRAVSMPLEFKVRRAVKLLQAWAPAALRMHEEGYWLSFSGGKDSCVIKELAKMADVPFKAVYNQTTIDPPELCAFIRKHHPDVEWSLAKKVGFFGRCVIQGLPTPRARWCCREFKERGGQGWFKVVGVRAPESTRRKKLWREQQVKMGAEYLAPICYWTDDDVWTFIRDRKIPYCSLYDEGFKRLGCVGCPLSKRERMDEEFKRWPRMENAYRIAAKKYCERREELWRSGKSRRKNAPLPFEHYWTYWRHQINRAPSDVKCQFEEMLEQIGVMSKDQWVRYTDKEAGDGAEV